MHLPVIRELHVAASEFALNFDGTLDRLHRAVKLRENIVARRIDDATFVPAYEVAKDRAVSSKEGETVVLAVIPPIEVEP